MTAKKLFLFLILTLILPAGVLANGQYGQYGEEVPSKDISVDKKVKNPNTGDWADNLFASDYKFKVDQEVEFKITIKNVGEADLDEVGYSDSLPSYLNYASGDKEATLDDLQVNESRDFYLKAKVSNDVPSGTSCVVNTAYGWIEGGSSDKDTAQVCLEKSGVVLGAVLPKAGPENSLLLLMGSLSLGAMGWVLLKQSI